MAGTKVWSSLMPLRSVTVSDPRSMIAAPVSVSPEDSGDFRKETAGVLGELRAALSTVVRALPNAPRRAADLQRSLKLDSRLAWAIFRVATCADPLAAGAYVPGRAPMMKALKAAAGTGVPEEAIQRTMTAFARFEGIVERHAGDRGTFDSMIADFTAEGAENLDLANKRAAFRASGHLWGVQMRARVECLVMQRSATPSMLDAVQIRGMIGLKQLRRGKTMRAVMGSRVTQDSTYEEGSIQNSPLDPQHLIGRGPFSLLREYCNEPLPEFRAFKDSAGFSAVELMSRGVGNRAAFTFFCGMLSRNVCHHPVGHPDGPPRQAVINLPTEVHFEDLLIHEDVWQGPAPSIQVFGTFATSPYDYSDSGRQDDLMPVQETLTEVGRGVDALDTPDVPNYPELVRKSLERVGWDPDRFHVFRSRIEYPVLFSVVRIGSAAAGDKR
jgi:hypothetical protein